MRHDKTNSKKLLIKMSPCAVCEVNEAVEIVIHDCQITLGSEPSMTGLHVNWFHLNNY